MLWLVCIEQNPATTRNKGGCKLLKQAQEGEGVLRRREGERGLSQADRANALCSSPSTPASFLSSFLLVFFLLSFFSPTSTSLSFLGSGVCRKAATISHKSASRAKGSRSHNNPVAFLHFPLLLFHFPLFLSSPSFLHSLSFLPSRLPSRKTPEQRGSSREKPLLPRSRSCDCHVLPPRSHTTLYRHTLTCVCNQLLVFAASIGTNTKNERTEEAPEAITSCGFV